MPRQPKLCLGKYIIRCTCPDDGFDKKRTWIPGVRTDHEIEATGPDLLIIDKRENNCQIIDVAMPEDGRVRVYGDEKVCCKEIPRPLERNSKDVGWKDKGDNHSCRCITL